MIEYHGLILERTRAGATDLAIAQLETSLGARLPEDYRQFLKICNGASVEYDVIAGKPSSHRGWWRLQRQSTTPNPVWERACSRKRSVCHADVDCATAIAGKPGSHRGWWHLQKAAYTPNPLWERARSR
ncbi:SMI1/KNR4 family protein [Pseudomonas corrugata]|uniref:SMI1/KNR4 family protein n=1 Tax=Pseudomonas corrugata TaxID=47879 RepID=UPI00087C7A20|nr:SMI1 / KNR4 family (SUKH-1) [Pseudomonas corrugata]